MNEQEKYILKLIKLVPFVIVIVFFLSILFIVINNRIQVNKQEIENIKKSYLQIKKTRIKDEVLSLVRNIEYEKKEAENNLKIELKNRVYAAYSIINNIYIQNKNKNKKYILKLIKDAIRPVRFNQDRGYFFIYDMNLTNILLPIVPKLEGYNFKNYHDIVGNYVVRDIARLCKEYGETFYSWYWLKPNDKKNNYKKIGFSKYFKPLNIFIGTGEYLSDFEKNLQKRLLKKIQYMRYGNDNYFFVLNYDGLLLTHKNSNLINRNFLDVKDNHGIYFVKNIINTAQNGGDFVTYDIKLLPDENSSKKISYVKSIDDWKWIIGSGEDMDDIKKVIISQQKQLKKELKETFNKLVILFIIVAIILIIFLTILSKRSKEIFLKYKNTLLEEEKKNRQQLMIIQNQNKLVAMGEMLGNISHQWKQPLNTLGISIGKLKLLAKEDTLTKEELLKSFKRMEDNISYLSKTIDVFRDFFRPSKKVELFNIKQEIEDALFIINDTLEYYEILVSFIIYNKIIIHGDRKKFKQVLLNILHNSKDAIISNKIPNPMIQITVQKINNKFAKIKIHDNAGGISSDIKDRIFEPYFTTKDSIKGTGVGLYMSKIIIENNFHGELTFENENNGVTFIITLPLNR